MSVNTKQNIKYKPQKIEFRVWTGKEMLYKRYSVDHCNNIYFHIRKPQSIKVIPCPHFVIPMLYTGLQDINNKKIYDGDILLIPDEPTDDSIDTHLDGPTEPNNYIASVIFNNGAFGVSIGDSKIFLNFNEIIRDLGEDYFKKIKILGNIFENPGENYD